MRSSTDTATQEDVGDGRAVAERDKRAKAREARRINGLKALMSSADGRLWMWEFLSTCGLFSTAFNGNSRDYFNLGQRNAAMPVFVDLRKHLMDEYLAMERENANA